MLTDRQKQACHNYIQHFNWSKAMRDAGYSPKQVSKNGWKLQQDQHVSAYLKSLMDKQQASAGLTAQRVLDELERMAFSDHLSFYRWSDKKKLYVLKPPDALTQQQRAAVKSYTPGKGYELYSKDSALDKLAKYFKLYSEIEATVTNFVLMPEMKLNGKKMEFNIGKPAPRRTAPQKKD